MAETVNHTALTTHSPIFSLQGGAYLANLAGTVAIGTESIELQRLVNGQYLQADPPIRFTAANKGGSILAVLPAGQYRWTVPPGGHSVNTSVAKQ